jgi:diacylglycerol kinase family enzyme
VRVRAILNRKGGTAALKSDEALAEEVATAFAANGVEADIRLVRPDEIFESFRAAASAEGLDAVVAGGGDGTLSCAAGHLAGTGRPLGVIPLGTLNHFARDAGIPAGIDEAVATIAGRNVRAVDVAEVNGRVFINNSAVGLYPQLVRAREAQRQRLGRSKRLAMLNASLRALRHFKRQRLTIDLGGLRAPLLTPLLFVGNNVYETSLLALGRRTRIDGGELCIYAPEVRGRAHFIGLGLRGLIGLAKQKDFVSLVGVEEAEVRSLRPALNVSVDGETIVLETPLRYRIRPGALRLIAPPDSAP